MEDKPVSSFVPCSGSTGAPELVPCGEIIDCPEKKLRIYYIDQEQIKMLEEFYGLKNGHRSGEALRPLSERAVQAMFLGEPGEKEGGAKRKWATRSRRSGPARRI